MAPDSGTNDGQAPAAGLAALDSYPLVDALVRRRSRRFALGNELRAGALTYRSEAQAVPLSLDEEAVLAFAGAGITGYVFGDLPYSPDAGPETGGGQVMVTMLGRTFPSADAAATSMLFVTRDDGTFALRRPQDFPREQIPELAALARRHAFAELYERSRIRLLSRRAEIPRALPYTPPFNKWSTNLPGATYFVPVTEITAVYLTVLFAALGEEFAYYFHDDRDVLARPAGLRRFAKSRGGHLVDDIKGGRVGTIDEVERYILELCAVEQGLMLQNLMLATEAIGLGGFPHYGAHRYGWLEAFGFRMRDRTFAQMLHKGFFDTLLMRLLGKNVSIPQAVGLEIDGEPLLKPYAPPYYPSMEAAVRAFVESKFAAGTGTFRDPATNAWKDGAAIQATIPEYSEANVAAVVAYCEHVFRRYGQFPGNYGPLRTTMAYQAHHVDPAFYDRFYEPGAYEEAHVAHMRRWHPATGATGGAGGG